MKDEKKEDDRRKDIETIWDKLAKLGSGNASSTKKLVSGRKKQIEDELKKAGA